jgi:hypothetical protein
MQLAIGQSQEEKHKKEEGEREKVFGDWIK